MPNPDVFTKSQIQLTVGEDYDSDTLTKQLMTIGYQKVSQVISPGEFSRRGDILDIYEITQELPYRLEFLVMILIVLGNFIQKLKNLLNN